MSLSPRSAAPRLIHTAQALVDEVIEVPYLPIRGLNTIVSSTTLAAGGAVNVLVAAARSGAEAVHAGSVGVGRNADLIRSVLDNEGVLISSPPVAGLDTGVCIVLVEPSAERTFITIWGAERSISPHSLQSSQPRPGDYVCVSGYSLQGATCEPLLSWLENLEKGIHVVVDPGAAFAEIDPAIQTRLLSLTTVWTSNAQEASTLAGSANISDSASLVAKQLPDQSIVVVRDGPAGCVVHIDEQTTLVKGYPQDPVDTNGAGDAHTGVLIAELCQGSSPTEAAKRANVAGAIKVTRRGPATAPTKKEIDAFLANQR